MKVLKRGRPQKGWSKKCKCTGDGNGAGGCGAQLLVEQADVFTTSSSHYDGSNESYYTFRCGACGVETDLPRFTNLPFSPISKAAWLKANPAQAE